MPVITSQLKELAAARAKVAALEQSITSELNSELAGLPAKFGFGDVNSFVSAVKTAAGGKRGRRRGRPAKATEPVKRRKRAKITDAKRAKVKQLVEAGKTGPEIAKAVGISAPSVANVKKQLGLTRPKGAKAK